MALYVHLPCFEALLVGNASLADNLSGLPEALVACEAKNLEDFQKAHGEESCCRCAGMLDPPLLLARRSRRSFLHSLCNGPSLHDARRTSRTSRFL